MLLYGIAAVILILQVLILMRLEVVFKLIRATFDRLQKLEHLENLFIKYEDSITLAASAADKLNKQQEKLETLYQFNTKAVAVVQTLARQRGAR